MSAANQIINILKNNITQIMAAVFLVSLIIVAITLMFKKRKEDRSEFFKQILALVIAAFIVISASSISGTLNYIIGNMTYEVNGNSGGEHETIEIEEHEERGFWQKGIDAIFIYIADAAEMAKKILVGTSDSIGIRAMLKKSVENPLADYNVPTKSGGTVNLYSIILNGTSFLTFLMIINTAYKLMKCSWNPSKREEVINALSKWAYVIVIIASMPALFASTVKIMDIIMRMFSEINLDYTLNVESNLSEYGLLWAILRIVMIYIEFRVFILMIYRTFVINAYYLTSPVAVYLWGVSDNFTAANGWLNGILINVFSPIAYELTFILATVIIRMFYLNNAIASLIVMLFGLTVGDALKGIVNYKLTGSVLGGVQDVKNMTRGVFGTMMTAITLSRLGQGIAGSKIFQASGAGAKVPPSSGAASSGSESNTFRNMNNNNAQNKTESTAEQLGRANINNKDRFSSNQSSPIKNNSFSQSMASHSRESGINYGYEKFDSMASLNKNSNKTENAFSGQEGIQNNTNKDNIGQSNLANSQTISSEKTANDTSHLGGQPELKKQTSNSEHINSFGFESPGYFSSSNSKTADKQSETIDSNTLGPKESLKNTGNQNTSNIKGDLSSVKKGIQTAAKGVPIAAGIGATIATGNPIIGLAASKGAQLSMNATGNIIKGGANAVKQTFESAKAATNLTKNTVQMINKAIKSNSDFKPYRRD